MSTTPVTMTREDVFAIVLRSLDQALIIPNLGSNTAALMRAGPRAADFYLWGGMGLTHSIGLGVALACPDRQVVVLDGDGSLLMGMSGLATIGTLAPPNLLHLVLDDSAWGNTGGQPTHTAWGTRLELVAQACGYPRAIRAQGEQDVATAIASFASDPQLTMVLVPTTLADLREATRDPEPVLIKRAFMQACATAPGEGHGS